MKRFLIATALVAAATPALAADVGVSVNIGQPGFYGRIDIGNYPPPVLVRPQPIIIQPAPVYVEPEPVYLYVPVYQQRNWRRYCRNYSACGQPVYFVQQDWYQREYAPRYREEHYEEHRRGHDEHRGDDRGEGRGDRHHDDHHGEGSGHHDD